MNSLSSKVSHIIKKYRLIIFGFSTSDLEVLKGHYVKFPEGCNPASRIQNPRYLRNPGFLIAPHWNFDAIERAFQLVTIREASSRNEIGFISSKF